MHTTLSQLLTQILGSVPVTICPKTSSTYMIRSLD